MMIGLMGQMGAGKTSAMSVLAVYLHVATKAHLSANYGLLEDIAGVEPATRIESLDDIQELPPGIFCFDEAWLTLDSRNYKEKVNIDMSTWINQTRKKKVICFYTTQHIRQIEMRMRNATDILIFCEKKPEGHWLTFIDWQYRKVGRRFLITHEQMRQFYTPPLKIYDTYEVLKPLKWKKGSKNTSYTPVKYGRNYG
jgi:hypothetical protein